MTADLAFVGRAPRPVAMETVGERIRNLQAQAKGLAREHVQALSAAMADLEHLATEIASGGDAYAPGARDLARQLATELESRGQTLAAIINRT